jgi:hypothetical protein
MSRSNRWRTVEVAALGVALGFLSGIRSGSAANANAAAEVYKPVIPADMFTKIVTDETKSLRSALAKASDKKMATKARSVALMIAVYAQEEVARGGPKAKEMAGLRDAALKTAKAVADGKFDDAKKLAAELSPAGKLDPAAKTTPMAVHGDFEIDTLMQVFKPERGGGLEWEKKLEMLKDKRSAYTAADYKQLVPLMYRIAAISQPTTAMVPAAAGKKNPADWLKFAKDMGDEAVAAAELARKPKPDTKAVKAAVKKLEATCVSCHDKFRD